MKPPKRMFFRKSSKGRGGVISNPKIYFADFGLLNRAFWAWKWYKRVIWGFRVCFSTIVLRKIKTRHTLKEAHLNPPPPPFRKFIRFGDAIRPYWKRTVGVFPSDNLPTATINPVLFKIRKFCTSVTVSGQNDNLLKSTCLSNLCTWIVLWLCWFSMRCWVLAAFGRSTLVHIGPLLLSLFHSLGPCF